MKINEKFIAETVKKNPGSDYWKLNHLFYEQMNGIAEGFILKSQEENLPHEDYYVKIRELNFLVDFFDYLGRFSIRET